MIKTLLTILLTVVVCSAFNLRVYHYSSMDSEHPKYSTLNNITGISVDSCANDLAEYFRNIGYHDTDGNENEFDLSNNTTFVTIFTEKSQLTVRCYGNKNFVNFQHFMDNIQEFLETYD